MAKRSSRILDGPRETNVELRGLFSVLQSSRGLESPKFISHGWPVSRHNIADHPIKFKQLPTSFDGECRKIRSVFIQDEAEAARVSFNGSAWNVLQGDMSIGENIIKQIVDKEWQHSKTDSVSVHDLVKAHKRVRRHNDQAYQPSSFSGLDDAASLTNLPSTSAEESWNKMSAKDLFDQMLIDREFTWKQLEPKSFSHSLEVLNLSKGRFIDLLPKPDSLLSRRFKNAKPSGTEKERIKSMLDAKLSQYMSKEANTSQKPASSSAVRKGKMNKHSWQKIDYRCSCSSKTSSVSQPNDKIVILKPVPQNVKNFEYVTCNPTPFTFRETRKKLNHAFGSARKESNQCTMNGAPDTLACSKSARKVGDDNVGCAVNTKRFFNSSTGVNMNGKVGKKQNLKSNRGSGVDCVTNAGGKNQEFDVILAAKQHLSERLRKHNSVADVRNKQPLRTLSWILASREHDFCLLSPRRNTCPSSSRLNVKLTSREDYGKDDEERKSSSMTTIGEEVHETDTSPTHIEMSNGQPSMGELDDMLGSELHGSEVSSDINVTGVSRTKLLKNDDSAEHAMLHSLSENETSTSPADDFQSTRTSVYQLDVVDSIKSQEHQSPVSVLDPYFIEYADSPQNTTLQSARRMLQPLRLDFEECASEPFPSNQSISVGSCTAEQDPLYEYVHLIMEASQFDCDQLSETWSLPDELLPSSLFDEVVFLPTDCYFDPKLLFDHMNEVLIEIHRSYFCFPSPFVPRKPKSTSLTELVLDKITRQADFYLHPHTERTLDQLVSGNAECCRSWLDLQPNRDQITADIAEDILEECIVDILLESLT